MKLITKQIANQIPPIGANSEIPAEEQIAHFKLFNPAGSGTWFITEASVQVTALDDKYKGTWDEEQEWSLAQFVERVQPHLTTDLGKTFMFAPFQFVWKDELYRANDILLFSFGGVEPYMSLGYSSFNELVSFRSRFGTTLERDLYFNPIALGKIEKFRKYK